MNSEISVSKENSPARILLNFLITISVAFFVVQVAVPLVIGKWFSIEIVAVGERNPSSNSDEVWVRLQTPNGRDMTHLFVPLDAGWFQKNGWWVAGGGAERKLRYYGRLDEKLTVKFVSHPWSGKVQIRNSGRNEVLDLYSPGSETKEKNVKINYPLWLKAIIGVIAILLFRNIGSYIERSAQAYFSQSKYLRVYILLSLALFALFIGLVWPFSKVVEYVRDERWLSVVALLFGLSSISLAVFARVVRWDTHNLVVSTRRDCIAAAVLVFLSGSFFLASFYPGLMSVDSVNAWAQVRMNSAIIDFPALHTIYMAAFSSNGSLATVALFQVAALSVLTYLVLNEIRHLGLSKLAVFAASLAMALSPVVMVTIVTHWRDVPYSLMVLVVTFLLVRIYRTNGNALSSYWFILFLGISLGLTALFRFNGVIVAFGIPLILALMYKTWARKSLMSLAVALLLMYGVKGGLYPAYGVVSSGAVNFGVAHHVAAHIKNGTPLTAKEKEFLNRIRQLDGDAWSYDCSAANGTIFSKKYDGTFAETNLGQFVRIAASLALRNPLVELKHQICVSDVVWRVVRFPELFNKYVFAIEPVPDSKDYRYIVTNPFVSEESFLPKKALRALQKAIFNIETPLLVRPAFYLYALLAALLVCALRTPSTKRILIVAPATLSTFSVVIFNVAQDVRYQYPIFLVATLLVPVFLLWPARAIPPRQQITVAQ